MPLKLADLINQGLILTKEEANLLLSTISRHSQHTPEDGIVFAGEAIEEVKAPAKPETAAQKKAREAAEKAEADAKKLADEAREKAVKEYTEVIGEAPADELTTEAIQKAIDAKLSE